MSLKTRKEGEKRGKEGEEAEKGEGEAREGKVGIFIFCTWTGDIASRRMKKTSKIFFSAFSWKGISSEF